MLAEAVFAQKAVTMISILRHLIISRMKGCESSKLAPFRKADWVLDARMAIQACFQSVG